MFSVLEAKSWKVDVSSIGFYGIVIRITILPILNRIEVCEEFVAVLPQLQTVEA